MSLSCPLCSVPLSPKSLEAHLRFELRLPLLACRLCPDTFSDRAEATDHFRGRFAEHPETQPQLIRPPSDPEGKARLLELLRLAEGGAEAVQQRLCVCGQCRLLCREDFRPTSGHELRRTLGEEEAKEPALEPTSAEMEAQAYEELREPEAYQSTYRPTSEDQAYEANLPPAQSEDLASEEDAGSQPVEVKPSVTELKPQLSVDGKVACLQCGQRVEKSSFYGHALSKHVPGNPFQCLLCPSNAKTRSELAKHQRREHQTELSEETHARSSSKELVQDAVQLCFGAAKDVEYGGPRCRPCDKRVRRGDTKVHVSSVHLKKTLFSCKACDFAIQRAELSNINRHVLKAHGLRPGPDTVDSSGMAKYAPIIKAMIPQLFGQ